MKNYNYLKTIVLRHSPKTQPLEFPTNLICAHHGRLIFERVPLDMSWHIISPKTITHLGPRAEGGHLLGRFPAIHDESVAFLTPVTYVKEGRGRGWAHIRPLFGDAA